MENIMGKSTRNQTEFNDPKNTVVDAADVELDTEGSGVASTLTVAGRLVVDNVSTHCSKTNAPHPSSVDDLNTMFALFCLNCDGFRAWMDGPPPMHQLYANGLG